MSKLFAPIRDQFEQCKNVFVQYKIFVPILLALVISAMSLSFVFGRTITNLQNKVEKVENNYILLQDIKKAVDSLLIKD